jgi:hypothetical protein
MTNTNKILESRDLWQKLAVQNGNELRDAKRKLEIAIDMLREASEIVMNAAAMDPQHQDLAGRIKDILGAAVPECGAFAENCSIADLPEGGSHCLTCGADFPA